MHLTRCKISCKPPNKYNAFDDLMKFKIIFLAKNDVLIIMNFLRIINDLQFWEFENGSGAISLI
jgi:hypothetical protein